MICSSCSLDVCCLMKLYRITSQICPCKTFTWQGKFSKDVSASTNILLYLPASLPQCSLEGKLQTLVSALEITSPPAFLHAKEAFDLLLVILSLCCLLAAPQLQETHRYHCKGSLMPVPQGEHLMAQGASGHGFNSHFFIMQSMKSI